MKSKSEQFQVVFLCTKGDDAWTNHLILCCIYCMSLQRLNRELDKSSMKCIYPGCTQNRLKHDHTSHRLPLCKHKYVVFSSIFTYGPVVSRALLYWLTKKQRFHRSYSFTNFKKFHRSHIYRNI